MEETPSELETESREEELSRKTLVGHSFFFSQTFAPFSTCVSENRPLVGIFQRLEKGGCAITDLHMWSTHAPITLTDSELHAQGNLATTQRSTPQVYVTGPAVLAMLFLCTKMIWWVLAW